MTIIGEGYETKMKKHTLTVLDTKEAMIVKVVMTMNRIFFLNIEMYVSKCLNTCVEDETWF